MPLKLNSTGGGSVTIDTPSTAGTYTVTVPATNQTLGITSGTAVSASGTSVDFTDIPSWVKRITVAFSALSTNGTSIVQIQLGTSGGYVTSGYLGSVDTAGGAVSATTFTTGLGFSRAAGQSAAYVHNGIATLVLIGNNKWSGVLSNGASQAGSISTGATSIDVGGVVDRIRITTVNGTNTFDAGTINIMYEG